MVSIWFRKYILSLQYWLKKTLTHCPLQKLESNKADLHGTIQHSENLNAQITLLTNNSVLLTKVAKYLIGNEDDKSNNIS